MYSVYSHTSTEGTIRLYISLICILAFRDVIVESIEGDRSEYIIWRIKEVLRIFNKITMQSLINNEAKIERMK